jgi:cyclophilin family peptidyl-prolyl cis-trans isomerase
MANAGPNTNGSQARCRRALRLPTPPRSLQLTVCGCGAVPCAKFFISLAPTPWLDGKHTIFGRVCSGRVASRRQRTQRMLDTHAASLAHPLTLRAAARRRMGVVKRMGMVATDKNDRPQTEVKILRATPGAA